MKNTLTIQTAFGIVIASLFSAFFAGAVVLGVGLSNPEEPQQTYTFISFIIGQGFMLVPLLWFLRSREEPIAERLRVRFISSDIIISTIYLSFGDLPVYFPLSIIAAPLEAICPSPLLTMSETRS